MKLARHIFAGHLGLALALVLLPSAAQAASSTYLQVILNKRTITNGDPAGYSFGGVVAGSTPPVVIVRVRNIGGPALLTWDLAVTGNFSIVEGLDSSIPTNGEDTFTIQMSTTEIGVTNGDVSFSSNAVDADVFTLGITGTILGTPPNDSFDDAVLIDGTRGSLAGTVIRATREIGEPLHVGTSFGSVWYRWVAPQTGTAKFSTANYYGFSGVISVYTGDLVDQLTNMAGAVGYRPESEAAIFPAEAGTVYSIAVAGDGTTYGSGFQMDWTMGPDLKLTVGYSAAIINGTADAYTFSTRTQYSEKPIVIAKVTNTGSELLLVSNLTLPDGYALREGLASSIPPFGYDEFTIEQNTSTAGTFIGNVTFKTNVDDNNDFSFGIKGIITPVAGPASPANDDFETPAIIGGEDGSIAGTNLGATDQYYDPSGNGAVWYLWTAPSAGSVSFSICNATAFNSRMAIVTGDTYVSHSVIQGITSCQIHFNAIEGQPYRISISSNYTAKGNFTLTWTLSPRMVVSSDKSVNASDLITNGADPGITFSRITDNHSPATASISIRNDGAAVLAITSLSATGGITINNPSMLLIPSGSSANFQVSTTGALPGTYLGAVSFDSDDPNQSHFTFGTSATITGRPDLPNDNFSDAFALSSNQYATDESFGATAEPGEPPHAGTPASRSIWYYFKVPISAPVNLSTYGSNFDTRIAVYTGSEVTALTPIASNDDSSPGTTTSSLTFAADSSKTYYVAIDGYNAQSGDVRLYYGRSGYTSNAAFFFTNSDEFWTFASPMGANFSEFSRNAGSLDTEVAGNNDSFAFWESPMLILTTDTSPLDDLPVDLGSRFIMGERGNESLYRCTFTVLTDQEDSSLVPVIRMRSSSRDFQRSDILVATSADDGSFSPSTYGTVYSEYFSLPQTDTRFRVDFDALNFGGIDAANCHFSLLDVVVERIYGRSNPILVRQFDFANDASGFTFRDATPALAAPAVSAVTASGIMIQGAAGVGTQHVIYGSWGLEDSSAILERKKLYRISAEISSTAALANKTNVPTFRIRVNDSSNKLAAMVNLNSSNASSMIPTSLTPQTYSVWFETPEELIGNSLIYSFDYLYVPGADDDPRIGLTMKNLKIQSYDVPE